MRQWLYRIQPTRPEMLTGDSTPAEDDAVSRHFNYLKDLTEKGVMILVGRTLNTDVSSFGICIFEAEDESAARHIMESDPAVQSQVMRAELFPYRVALMQK